MVKSRFVLREFGYVPGVDWVWSGLVERSASKGQGIGFFQHSKSSPEPSNEPLAWSELGVSLLLNYGNFNEFNNFRLCTFRF